ncbi:MAG: tetratricopeptide repeat protein [Candidatus Omnitrophica bacterium]|nr:tetratricopeptide repeat protein [Candidatus Omnitrophota bacterium]
MAPVIKHTFLNTLKRFNKLIISFVAVFTLFAFYNTFVIDRILGDLKFTLSQAALAYDIGDTNGLDLLLNEAIVDEVTSAGADSQNLGPLEFAKSIFKTGKNYNQLDYAKVALKMVVSDKERRRGFLLVLLDNINSWIKKAISYLTHLPQSFQKHKINPITAEGKELLAKAYSAEKANKLDDVANYYSDFIKKYPDCDKITTVKLRLAYCYHRKGDYKQAEALYQNIIRNNFNEKEYYIAQSLMFRLKQQDKLLSKIDTLLIKADELPPEDTSARQEIYYEIGVIQSRLFNFDESKTFFKRSIALKPDSKIGLKSLFNLAWTFRETGNFSESLELLAKLIKDNEDKTLASESSLQSAQILHDEGDYQGAVNIYIGIADKYKNESIAALALFQAGASCLYDLNDTEQSKLIFSRLITEHPDSLYAKYLAPDNSIGIFITYLVPRATRVVSWRAGGLLALSGYSGEISKFKMSIDEVALNTNLNNWLKAELPDTVGNLYVDIRGTEIRLLKGKATGEGRITMGKFNVRGQAEGHLQLDKDGRVSVILTKAILDKIPVFPPLINNTLTGLSLLGKKYFPIFVTNISMEKEKLVIDGYGSKRMLERIDDTLNKTTGFDRNVEEIKDPRDREERYRFFKERYPESDFSPAPKEDTESLFNDFFTRMYFYMGFKILETVKDTKFDYERSVRTLGVLMMRKQKFRVSYKEADINKSLNKYIANEFPWVLNNEFLFDIKGLELHLTDNGDVAFDCALRLGFISFPKTSGTIQDLTVNGRFSLEIDSKTKIPRVFFKEIFLNGKSISLDRINLVTKRCLNLVEDGHIPFQLEEVNISKGEITLKGEGARDFTARIFGDPDLFVIFQIRKWDLAVAGIQRLKDCPQGGTGDYWRGKGEAVRPEGDVAAKHKAYR